MIPEKLVSILLPSVNHVLTDSFQLFVDLVGLDAVRPECVAKGVCHRTHDAALDESVPLASVAVGGVRIIAHQEVVECRCMEQGLEGRVEVTGVADVEHTSSRSPLLPISNKNIVRREIHDLEK
jgi:hypothetical protein